MRILGTDIDRRMIERAGTGVFSDDDARTAPQASMNRWFERVSGGWQASGKLRAMTHFEIGDLLRSKPSASSYDLVFCRNTVIYFSEPIRDELHGRLAHSLRSGGWLVIGATERITDPGALGLHTVFPFIFRKA